MGGDHRPAVLVVSITVFVLASCFVILRFISRIFVVRKLGLHDHLMLLAWLLNFGFSFSLFYATRQGLGLHIYDVNPSTQYGLNRAEYAFTVLYNPALMAVKSSILVFYLALTRGEWLFRCANYVTLFVVNAAGLALTFVNVFQCNPVSAVFHSSLSAERHCTDIITLYLSSSPVNIVTDLAILFLPMPLLTHMHLPLKQKIILVITFSFGFFVAIVDVIRIAYLQGAATSRAENMKSVYYQGSGADDFTWYASLSFMWSVVEVNVSIICACVPSLKPLVSRILPKLIRDTGDYSQNTPNNLPAAVVSPGTGQPAANVTAPNFRSDTDNNETKSSQAANASRRDPEDMIDIVDFLTTPGMGPQETETETALTSDSHHTITFFDFVNMKQPKSMLKLDNYESIAPNALATILFFLWGFAYGLLDILNSQFQQIIHLDMWRSLGLHAAYYGGYVVGPFLGLFVLKKWGFKSTFIVGLNIYACGSLIFWPSAVLTSFAAFTVSNFVVGIGLAVLEVAANPFIALCGPLENSEIRLNISQGVQAIGSVVSPLLAKKVLFKNVRDVSSLVDVQWTYLAITLFDVLLAVVFYYLPFPEASDEDLEELADRRQEDNSAKVFGVPVVLVTLVLGVSSQFFYVSGQEVLSTSFISYVSFSRARSSLDPFEYLTIGHTLFAVGRFIAAFAQLFLKPRWILLISFIGSIVFSVLCMNTTGLPAVTMGLMVYLFESSLYPTTFAISLRGASRHTKTASSLLTTAVSGGFVFPFAQHATAVARGISYSYCIIVALFSAATVFALYLNLVPAARKQVDPVPNEYLRRHHRRRRQSKQKGNNNDENNDNGKNDNDGGNDNDNCTINDILNEARSNPASGGVLSRQRSLVADPLSTLALPERRLKSSYSSSLPSHESSAIVSRGEGGIMHDLAPWPGSS